MVERAEALSAKAQEVLAAVVGASDSAEFMEGIGRLTPDSLAMLRNQLQGMHMG